MAASAQTRTSFLKRLLLSTVAVGTVVPAASALAETGRAAAPHVASASNFPPNAVLRAQPYVLPAGTDIHHFGQPVYLTSEPGGVRRSVDAGGKPINTNGWTVQINDINAPLLQQQHKDVGAIRDGAFGLKTLRTDSNGVVTGVAPYEGAQVSQPAAGPHGMSINGGNASIVRNGGDKPSYDVRDKAGQRVAAGSYDDKNNIHIAGYKENGDFHYQQDKKDKDTYHVKGKVNGEDCEVDVKVHHPKKDHAEANANATATGGNASATGGSAFAEASVSVVTKTGSISQAGATAIVAGIVPNFTQIDFGTEDVVLHIPPGGQVPPTVTPPAPPAPPAPAVCVSVPTDHSIGVGGHYMLSHVGTYSGTFPGGTEHIIDIEQRGAGENIGNIRRCVEIDGTIYDLAIGYGRYAGKILRESADGKVEILKGTWSPHGNNASALNGRTWVPVDQNSSASVQQFAQVFSDGVAEIQGATPSTNDTQARPASPAQGAAPAVGAPVQLAPPATDAVTQARLAQILAEKQTPAPKPIITPLSATEYNDLYAKAITEDTAFEVHGQGFSANGTYDTAGNIKNVAVVRNGKVSQAAGTFVDGEVTMNTSADVMLAVDLDLAKRMGKQAKKFVPGAHYHRGTVTLIPVTEAAPAPVTSPAATAAPAAAPPTVVVVQPAAPAPVPAAAPAPLTPPAAAPVPAAAPPTVVVVPPAAPPTVIVTPPPPPPPPVIITPPAPETWGHWFKRQLSINQATIGNAQAQVASAAVTNDVTAIMAGMNDASANTVVAQQTQRIDLGNKQRAHVAFKGAQAEVTFNGKGFGRTGAMATINTVTGEIIGEIRSAKAGVADETTYGVNGQVVNRSVADMTPAVIKAVAKLRTQFAQSATTVAARPTLVADWSKRLDRGAPPPNSVLQLAA